MLKRDGKVYTQIVKNCSASELIPILSQYSELDSSTIYSDCWKAYDGLVDYGAKAHYRVKHSKNEFANGKNHINGIENFWGYAKHRLSKFKGIKKENFRFILKNANLDIITECCELEDIFEIIPTKYIQTLRILQNRIIKILKRYDEEPRKRWVIIDEE